MTSINDYCTKPNYLAPETAECEGVLEVVKYIKSIGKRAIGVGRATVTVEQIDLTKLFEKEKTYVRNVAPLGACYNPLLIRFYHDPCAWTLAGEELDEKDKEVFLGDGDVPDADFIRSYQYALVIHGGRYGLYEIYKIDNPDDPLEDWKWEKLSYLSCEEERERIALDLQNNSNFNGTYLKLKEITNEGGKIYQYKKDAELKRLGEEMKELCRQYMTRLTLLEKEFHQPEGKDEDLEEGL